VAVRPELADLIGMLPIPPVEVVRPTDLVHLTFSFVNLRLEAGEPSKSPLLKRRATNRPAYLVVDHHSQHITELAFFETAVGFPVTKPRPPLNLPPGAEPTDPDMPPKGPDLLRPPPVFASLAGPTRLVFRVTNEAILFSVAGLLDAITKLDLSVAPHATPPSFSRISRFGDELAEAVDLGSFLSDAVPRVEIVRGRLRVEVPEGPLRAAAELTAIGRMRATAAELEYRFGTAAALRAVHATTIGPRLGIGRLIDRVDVILPVDPLPPLPRAASPTETSIELPWRLQVSPNTHGAFAHSPTPVEHGDRVELWHTRLGVRAIDANGKPLLDEHGDPIVDERSPQMRTIRAIWARDFDVFLAIGKPQFGFKPSPKGVDFPAASGAADEPRERMALNSRDRMMLVHQTSNFHLKRRRRAWTPPAVPTNRLMLTALGGWLDSRVLFPTLPDGGLTIQEWKHRAALGRDHEVKVVYAGFLLPFGHKASLIKVTERKFAAGPTGTTAYLFQRMFIVVREPEKQFRDDSRPLGDGRRLDLTMPFGTVRILTRVTPLLDPPTNIITEPAEAGFIFQPAVASSPFLFKILAVDLEENILEFSAPLVFMERDRNEDPLLEPALDAYNASDHVLRELDLRGQRVAYAESKQPDDTILSTRSVIFEAVTANFLKARPQDEPRFAPALREAKAVVPAMSALAGAATPTRFEYPLEFAKTGFNGNGGQVFLKTIDQTKLSFAGQGQRSGGLVTPNLDVSGLSRLTGPIGGNVGTAITSPATFSIAQFFEGASAKLFGLIPLSELFEGVAGFTPEKVPTFVTQTLDIATTLKQNVERIRNAALAHAAELGAAGTQLKLDVDALLGNLAVLANDPGTPPDLGTSLAAIAADLGPFVAAVESAPALPRAEKDQLVSVARRVEDQLADAGAAVTALIQFAQGLKLPEVVNARLDWSTEVNEWPKGTGIFQPVSVPGKLTLAVEIQAPTKPGNEPSATVSCSLTPFQLRLIAPATFLTLHFQVVEFSMVTGKKPDVNVQLRQPDGITFEGPLEFVNTLKDLVPFDGFSDPPYLDVTAEGVKAGFDLPIPDVAVGVFALTNINLGAHFKVPFLDESIETAFNFAKREDPFRLQVALFAGGGFFGITITPERVRVLEAALEFGAAIAINFGVASGGVSVMAGIYFRLETDDNGDELAELTGYFRMRGEVDVLGLISASIELYLSLTYETSTGKAVGRATITVEVEVLFFSASVKISCEKKFAGSNGDPTFVEVMGLPSPAPVGAVRPWDIYCRAFADE
jgi:hypothetical protein